MPRIGLHLALGLLLSSCGGTTLEDTLGEGNSLLDGAAGSNTDSVASSGGVGGSGAPQNGGGSAGRVTSGGSGGTENASRGGAAGTTHDGGDGGHGGSGAIDAGAPDDNLIANSSFESGHSGWGALGSAPLVDVEGDAHSGLHYVASTNRTQEWMGPLRSLNSLVTEGTSYDVSAWVRISEGNAQGSLTLRWNCQFYEMNYAVLAQRMVDTEWTLLEGTFSPPTCTLDVLQIFINGPPAGVDIFVDDVALRLAD